MKAIQKSISAKKKEVRRQEAPKVLQQAIIGVVKAALLTYYCVQVSDQLLKYVTTVELSKAET